MSADGQTRKSDGTCPTGTPCPDGTTVYGDETSHLSPTRDVPRIVGMLVRLTFEGRPPERTS